VALITKWKGASREAAEEVFGDVRDRVNRMGGVGAWRAEGMRREEWRGGWGGVDEGAERRGGDGAEEGEGESKREEVVDEGEDDDVGVSVLLLRCVGGRRILGGELELMDVDVHDGHDAPRSQCRSRCHRLR